MSRTQNTYNLQYIIKVPNHFEGANQQYKSVMDIIWDHWRLLIQKVKWNTSPTEESFVYVYKVSKYVFLDAH